MSGVTATDLVVYTVAGVNVGDVIAYPGALRGRGRRREVRRERDWLTVSRIDEHGLHGYRVHPQEWERDCEFVVVTRQVTTRGVAVSRPRALAVPLDKDAGSP